MGKPIIRFKGYEDDWEQRKLGDVAEKVCVGFVGTCEKFYTDESGVPMYRTGNLNGLSLNRDDLKYVTHEFHQRNRKSQLKTGDILIARHGDSGKAVNYESSEEANCLNIVIIRPDFNECNYKFLTNCINSPGCQKHIKSLSAGSTQAVINTSEVEKLEVVMSVNIDEQNSIARYFSIFDHLITLHQRKCEQTKTLKKYMLQKMFPQNGEKVPEIRFSGFTDDWEQRKLGDIAQSFEYGLNAAAKEYDGTNKYLRITDIDDVSRKFNTDNLTSPDIELSTAENYRLLDGDILFARTGASVGKSFIYRDSDGIVYFAGFLIRARIKSEYDAEFVFQNTLCGSYGKYIQITSQRSGQPGVNAKEYSDYAFYIPTYDEQKKVGNFLHQIDNLITLHQRKCDELQKIKKFMLQNMFV